MSHIHQLAQILMLDNDESVRENHIDQQKDLLKSFLKISWSWEYTKESFPFHFVLPGNLVKKTASMDVLVSKIPEKYRETAKSFLEIALSFLSKVPKKDFKLEARIDIPWAKDIVNKANVRIDY